MEGSRLIASAVFIPTVAVQPRNCRAWKSTFHGLPTKQAKHSSSVAVYSRLGRLLTAIPMLECPRRQGALQMRGLHEMKTLHPPPRRLSGYIHSWPCSLDGPFVCSARRLLIKPTPSISNHKPFHTAQEPTWLVRLSVFVLVNTTDGSHRRP
jgi:hypothetical protein